MATTDARPGFKLPWSADRTESETNDVTDASAPASPTDTVAAFHAGSPGGEPTAPEAPAVQAVEPAQPVPAASFDPWRLGSTPPAPLVEAPKRKPNKLMADLTRAMQSAAEVARDETLERLQVDAKAFIESIHTRSGSEADELRQTADNDIAGIREWSKAEIARIREETDQRISDRKSTLEHEVEEHAARIEARIERVQAHVSWFETEMAGFFERLLAEDDPTRLAAMAENLPEPPSFEDDLADVPRASHAPTAPTVVEQAVETVDTHADDVPADPESAFAAIQAAAEAAAEDEARADAPVTDETNPGADADRAVEADDPRLAVLGLSSQDPGAGSTEVESAADGDPLPTFSDDALSARLAGLVPNDDAPHVEQRSTRVVVTGLISVASIAGFKRHLGRLAGVSSVGVSSGPDGEFVFAVMHDPALDLAGAVPTLPGFAAHVTASTSDTVTVAARDPETES